MIDRSNKERNVMKTLTKKEICYIAGGSCECSCGCYWEFSYKKWEDDDSSTCIEHCDKHLKSLGLDCNNMDYNCEERPLITSSQILAVYCAVPVILGTLATVGCFISAFRAMRRCC